MSDAVGIQPLSADLQDKQCSKLVAWEVWNFMSIEHAKVEFDDRNIINLKGYNDSGKSAMLRALDVLFFNIKPSSQVGFIQDDKDYFRVIAYFDDGVWILRDKYVNGQGLYMLYKGNDVLFSTKQNNMLSKITEVPQPIQDYLGLVTCDAWNVNSRSNFEKQLLVGTTGSENYKALNEVLRSEEIAVAGEMLNGDKNRLKSDIHNAEQELDIYKSQIRGSAGVSEEMLDKLKRSDEKLENSTMKLSSLNNADVSLKNIQSIPNIPKVMPIESERIKSLAKINDLAVKLNSIPQIPETGTLNAEALKILNAITSARNEISSIPTLPQCLVLEKERLGVLAQLTSIIKTMGTLNDNIAMCDKEVLSIKLDLSCLNKQLEVLGKKYVVCQSCGAYVSTDGEHLH